MRGLVRRADVAGGHVLGFACASKAQARPEAGKAKSCGNKFVNAIDIGEIWAKFFCGCDPRNIRASKAAKTFAKRWVVNFKFERVENGAGFHQFDQLGFVHVACSCKDRLLCATA